MLQDIIFPSLKMHPTRQGQIAPCPMNPLTGNTEKFIPIRDKKALCHIETNKGLRSLAVEQLCITKLEIEIYNSSL